MSGKAVNLGIISKKIEKFILSYVSASPAQGLVIGLSGGLDSSVALKLAVNALGPTRVTGLIMPSSVTPGEDTADAVELARSLGIKHKIIEIDPILRTYAQSLRENQRARGNLSARVRMNLLYYHAAVEGYLVAGTSDKSERMIGFFTKYGDGAADILPIADLYKTEVRRLALFLKIPSKIIEKKSSPRLWQDHLAEEEIGLSYDELDPILRLLVDKKKSASEIAKKLGIPLSQVKRVVEMIRSSEHKRRPVPFAKL